MCVVYSNTRQVETIEGKLMWLECRLGMDREKAVRVIMTFPLMLSLALNTMDWKIVWLQQRLGLNQEQLVAVVVKYPNLLAYSIEDNLEPTLRWLEQDLGLEASVAGMLVLRQPRLLTANLEHNLKNKVISLFCFPSFPRSRRKTRVQQKYRQEHR